MRRTFDTPRLDRSGGALCLDFVNAWGDRGRPAPDGSARYGLLLALAVQEGVLDRAAASRLAERAGAAPRAARRVVRDASAMREVCYLIFSSVAAAGRPPVAALDRLNATLPEALARLRLAWTNGRAGWRWSDPRDDLNAPLWPIVRSAAELLASKEAERVRECDSESCHWLFLDRSRNRSRRWCSMASCGNRAKARRHYRRSRGRDSGAEV